MVDLVVRRNGGNNPGEDIVDPLIASDAVAIARGRNELDARAQGFVGVRLTVYPRNGLLPGQLLENHDSFQGQSYRGKIKRVVLRRERAGEGFRSRAYLDVDKISEFQ